MTNSVIKISNKTIKLDSDNTEENIKKYLNKIAKTLKVEKGKKLISFCIIASID